MKKKFLFLTLAVSSLSAFAGMGDSAKSTPATTGQQSQFRTESDQQVLLWQKRIETWKKQRDSLAPESARYKLLDEKVVRLETQLGTLRSQIDRMQSDTTGNWNKYKAEIDATVANMKQDEQRKAE